jgi:diguanylate cyclase (GGDEF)-like protein
MIVDDEAENLKILGKLLDSEYQTIFMNSGDMALKYLEDAVRLPDLILLDVIMPGSNGFEVCKKIKNNNDTKDILVVFMTSLSSEDDEKRGFDAGAIDFITKPFSPSIVKTRVRNHVGLKKHQNLLADMASIDPLTGIPNRRHFEVTLTRDFAQLKRYKGMLSCLMIDIDHFKDFNDIYGHLAGDNCIKYVAKAIQDALPRSTDFCARYGGEEFVVLLPGTDKEGARNVADLILKAVIDLNITHERSSAATIVTVSVGSATISDLEQTTQEALIDMADKALYNAKKQGRNRVESDSGTLITVSKSIDFADIEDIATKSIVTLDIDDTIKDAIDTITDKHIRNIVIHDKNRSKYFVLSVNDLVQFATHKDKLAQPVSTLELKPLPICSKNTNILEEFIIFGKENAIVGVADELGRLLGIVTYSNMLDAAFGFTDQTLAQPVNKLIQKESLVAVFKKENLLQHLEDLETSANDCIIALDENAKPCGIVTKRDVVNFLSQAIDLNQTIEALMSSPIVTIPYSLSLNSAIALMHDNRLKRVVVVNDDNSLVGVVTQKELLDTIYSRMTQKGFFSLGRINQMLQKQVSVRTAELQNLNMRLEEKMRVAGNTIKQLEEELAKLKSELTFTPV